MRLTTPALKQLNISTPDFSHLMPFEERRENFNRLMGAFQSGGVKAFLNEWDAVFPDDQLSSAEKERILAQLKNSVGDNQR